MNPFKFKVEQRVTVMYPPSKRYPNGRQLTGEVCRRSVAMRGTQKLRRYAVIFDDGGADTLIPEYWLEAAGQVALSI